VQLQTTGASSAGNSSGVIASFVPKLGTKFEIRLLDFPGDLGTALRRGRMGGRAAFSNA
jgi:hypothetical protein